MPTPIPIGTLLGEAVCYACYAPGDIPSLARLALWSRIAQGGSGGISGAIVLTRPGETNVINPAMGEYMFDTQTWVTMAINNVDPGVGVQFDNAPNLISVTITNQPLLFYIFVDFSPTLATITMTNVGYLGDIEFAGNPGLTTLSFPITSCGYLGIFSDVNLTSLSLTALDHTDSDLDLFGNFKMSSLNLGVLKVVSGHINLNNSNAMTAISLPSLLNFSGAFSVSTCPLLTSLNVSAMTSRSSGGVGQTFDIAINGALTTVSFPALWPFVDAFDFNATGCALNVATVNAILVSALAAVPAITGIVIDLSGGTSAAPTGAGAAAKIALNLAGNTVTTN